MNLPKIDTSNLLDKTYTIIKDLIIKRKFKPNEKLLIPELSKQLGVSRTPIRDALNRLEMDGLVKTVSKVGTFVNAVDIEDVLDAIDTRLMLEFWVADKLPTLAKEELLSLIDNLSKILNNASTLIEDAPFDTFLKSNYNLAFHMEFIKAGKNKRNIDIYENVMNYHQLASQYSLIKKDMATIALNQHYAIIEVLKKQQFDILKEALELHLDDSKQRLIREISENKEQL
ncbi:MAG: GntR family transcriptional regulator [Firmicutes bacterium]|nr:GntR family transcriptional regulator [Bacillota bacterium]